MRSRRRSAFNPFISLTDILFNLVLVLIFAAAIFAQDVGRKHAENVAFQNRLANIELERDTLIRNIESLSGQLDEAVLIEGDLRNANLSLEEQIAGLLGNLDLAQIRQQRLSEQIRLVLGELGDSDLERQLLEQKLTVVIGELDVSQTSNRLLETEVNLILGDLTEAQLAAVLLREQVSELSRNNFLVVELEWLTQGHDLDLHVTDPSGRRYFWNRPTHPDSSARLTLDNRLGARPDRPGLEIWTARELSLGTYRVEVGLWGCGRLSESDGYKPCLTDAAATLLVRHRDGDDLITNLIIPLDQSYAQSGSQFSLNEGLFNRLVLVAEVQVLEDEGEVRVLINPEPGLPMTRLALAP